MAYGRAAPPEPHLGRTTIRSPGQAGKPQGTLVKRSALTFPPHTTAASGQQALGHAHALFAIRYPLSAIRSAEARSYRLASYRLDSIPASVNLERRPARGGDEPPADSQLRTPIEVSR